MNTSLHSFEHEVKHFIFCVIFGSQNYLEKFPVQSPGQRSTSRAFLWLFCGWNFIGLRCNLIIALKHLYLFSLPCNWQQLLFPRTFMCATYSV